jgi:hypothetical protein
MRFILPGLAIALLGTAAIGQPAWADAAAPPAQGSAIVQQALSYLVVKRREPLPIDSPQREAHNNGVTLVLGVARMVGSRTLWLT